MFNPILIVFVVGAAACAPKAPVLLRDLRPTFAREVEKSLQAATRRFEGRDESPTATEAGAGRPTSPLERKVGPLARPRAERERDTTAERNTTSRGGMWRLLIPAESTSTVVEVSGPVNFEWIPKNPGGQ